MQPFIQERRTMVLEQLARRGIRDLEVLRAMVSVPRESFVPAELIDHAYDDSALPIGEAQTISQPWIVARMAEAACLGRSDRVLEVGTGSGYGAAVYAELAALVFTIERRESLHRHAVAVLDGLGYDNVLAKLGDGTLGLLAHAPFDAILVSAADEVIPEALLAQLAIGGRLVMPLGRAGTQKLVRVERLGRQRYARTNLSDVRFVPLLRGTESSVRPA
jgi:protein-L-isoaspartate(D-aspartate) O-methyltransferase